MSLPVALAALFLCVFTTALLLVQDHELAAGVWMCAAAVFVVALALKELR